MASASGGDEFARAQNGNNNAYCQDNEISWFDWDLASRNDDLIDFFRKAIAFCRRFPVLQRRKFRLHGHWDPQWIVLPPLDGAHRWHRAIDTSLAAGADFADPGREVRIDPADHYIVNSRSTVVLLAR